MHLITDIKWVFFHTAPSPQEEGKPLPRPALATEKAGRYNHGKHHDKFVPLPSLLFCQATQRMVLWVVFQTIWQCHCFPISISIQSPHTPCPVVVPVSMCGSIFSAAHFTSPLPIRKQISLASFRSHLRRSVISSSFCSSAFFFTYMLYHLSHLGQAFQLPTN